MLNGDLPPPASVVAEVARVAALRSYAVLDQHVPMLAGVAELAAKCMSCRMGAVSFVDIDRVWFGAAFGFAGGEIARDRSFCGEAITTPGTLVVADARADSRFASIEPEGVRFYAGAVLVDEGGYRLGTVCVFDPAPRQADPAGLLELSRLASMTMGTLKAYRETLSSQSTVIPPGPELVQGWLGVRTKSSRPTKADPHPGLVVISVAANSPAERAGIRPADILLAIDGAVLSHSADVLAALANRPVSSHACAQLVRAGRTMELMFPVESSRPIRSIGRLARVMAD